jgi:hypothetical protein
VVLEGDNWRITACGVAERKAAMATTRESWGSFWLVASDVSSGPAGLRLAGERDDAWRR